MSPIQGPVEVVVGDRPRRTVLVASGLALAMAAGAATGQGSGPDRTFKITPDDGADDDWFGRSVAVSDGRAIVGAPHHAGNVAPFAGAAYLFDAATGERLFKLTASDASQADLFGGAVAIDGELVVVGASHDDPRGDQSGSAYVFDATSGRELFKLFPDRMSAGAFFGGSVAVHGQTAIIGAPLANNGAGTAFLYDLTTGQALYELTAGLDARAGDQFGFSVGIDEGVAIVGTPQNDDRGGSSGTSFLFDVTTGELIARLTGSDTGRGDQFGVSVAIRDGIAVVGAPAHPTNGSFSGAAYLFDARSGQQIAKLIAPDASRDDFLGVSVATDGSTVIAGALWDVIDGVDSGSAMLFDATTGEFIEKLTADDAEDYDEMGISVGIDADTAIVGARFDDVDGARDSGSAYVFELVPVCPVDLNGDGVIDADDFFEFLDLFASQDPAADIDGSGVLDADDFFEFLAQFAAGCP